LHLKLTSKYLWKPVKCILVASLIFLSTPASWAQQEQPQDACTSTDLWMLGSDFVRPGLAAKANYKIGIGHTFGFLKKDPIGDELTFGYTYEDAGSGFWHSQFGSHTESVGVMKNFGLPKTKLVTGLPGFNRALRVLPETPPCRTISITVSLWAQLSTSMHAILPGFKRASTRWSRHRGTRPQALDIRGVGDLTLPTG
jgi:hypothetical protein